MQKKIIFVFWISVASFIFVLSEMLVPFMRDIFGGSILFLLPLLFFSAVGFVLVFLVIKSGVYSMLHKFLFVSGLASVAFSPCVLLHNVFYGLTETFQNILALKYIMGFFDVVFFVTAVFVCPLVYAVAVIGGVVMIIRGRK